MYALLAFVQGYITWSAILRHTGPWEILGRRGPQLLRRALTVLSLVGLRCPVRMMPLLV